MADPALINQLREQIAGIEADAPQQANELHESSGSRKAPLRPDEEAAGSEAAFSKLVALVNVSDRSERAIRDRLAQAGFDLVSIDDAVEKAKSYGFIDDMRFADVLIRSRLSQGKGSAGIERDLAANNIEASTVPGWPHEYGVSPDSELDRALALLNRRPPRSKNLRDGAYRKLVGKGFASSVASSAARIWLESLERGV